MKNIEKQYHYVEPKSNNQILYDYGYKAGNKKTLLEFFIWLLVGFVLGILATIIYTSI